MSDSVINVENLSKKYILSHQHQERYAALRDVLANGVKRLGKKILSPFTIDSSQHSQTHEEFYALRDVTFEIKQGDRVGIIGRNGAGKSTLLKILSRITEPTSGRIEITGRVASLLEVGTGFHPELTGRENIFLNGAILGMGKAEIRRKFDEIVDFAEIEKFLDTPVKRYSSGMYVRLAFAVAAHLEPEILIVDEVLAVGDAQFQKKCLGRMQEVGAEGRTVLFVSHNMAAIQNLCNSGIHLSSGTITCIGGIQHVVEKYLNSATAEHTDLMSARPRWALPFLTSAKLVSENNADASVHKLGASLTFQITFASPEVPVKKPVMGIVINHATIGTVGGVNTRMTGTEFAGGPFYQGKLQCVLESVPLLQGKYTADIWFGDGEKDLDVLLNYISFEIEATDIYHSGVTPFATMGIVFLKPTWSMNPC